MSSSPPVLIGHTADWHIGATPDIPDNYKRQVEAIKRIFKLCMKKKVSALLVAGDVFEAYEPSQYEKDLFLELVVYFDKVVDFPVFVLEGNHSTSFSYSNLVTYKKLERAGALKQFHFILTPELIETDSFVLSAVPHGHDFNKIPKQHRKQALATKKPWVVMLHELLSGSRLESGIKKKTRNRLEHVKGVVYYACGDVHKAGKVSGKANAWYSGSPIQHNFGETLPKGILLVDLVNSPEKPKLATSISKGIKKLVTVSSVEDIPPPEEAYVRLKRPGSAESVTLDAMLPDHVISIEDDEVENDTGKDGETLVEKVEKSIDYEEELKEHLKQTRGYTDKDLVVVDELFGDVLANVSGKMSEREVTHE